MITFTAYLLILRWAHPGMRPQSRWSQPGSREPGIGPTVLESAATGTPVPGVREAGCATAAPQLTRPPGRPGRGRLLRAAAARPPAPAYAVAAHRATLPVQWADMRVLAASGLLVRRLIRSACGPRRGRGSWRL